MMPEEIVFCKGGGCTAKLGAGVLERILSRLPKPEKKPLNEPKEAMKAVGQEKLSAPAGHDNRHEQIQRLLDKSNNLKEHINEQPAANVGKTADYGLKIGQKEAKTETGAQEENSGKNTQLDDLEKLILEAFK